MHYQNKTYCRKQWAHPTEEGGSVLPPVEVDQVPEQGEVHGQGVKVSERNPSSTQVPFLPSPVELRQFPVAAPGGKVLEGERTAADGMAKVGEAVPCPGETGGAGGGRRR